MKLKILLLGVLLSSTFLHAQNLNTEKLDSLFSTIESNGKGMGAISIFRDGKEVYQKNYGYADLEKGIKSNSTTKYRIASISKTFTATVIMKLMEEGKISLDSKLSQFYPQIKNSDKITIQHLLQHRTGIFNFTSATDYMEWHTNKQTKEQLINKIELGGVTFAPDEKFEYSNSNYALLTFIAEDVSGDTFSDLIDKVIVNPCGLKNTYVGSDIKLANNEAYSYTKLSSWAKEQETDMSVLLGTGCIVSTATDLNIFLNCLFAEKIVNAESLQKMTSLKDNFGLGLFQVSFYNMVGYGHTGVIDGFQSNAFYFPAEKLSIALLENGAVYPLNDIIVGALSIYFHKPYPLPTFTESIVLASEDLDKYLGVYSSPTFPLKLSITKKDNTLVAQGTGQPSFPLECFGQNKFKFDQAKLELEFIPDENKMMFKQNGMTFDLARE